MELTALRQELLALRSAVVERAAERLARWQPWLSCPEAQASAENLAHYLSLRSFELRRLQRALSYYGLSSLGRSESRVLANLDAILATVTAMLGETYPRPAPEVFFAGEAQLARRQQRLFGAGDGHRRGRIMVTLPTEAAADAGFVRELLARGMDAARINCAHDSPEQWQAMIANLRRASGELGRACPVLMDLTGPKVRIIRLLNEHGPKSRRLKVGDRFWLLPPDALPPDDGSLGVVLNIGAVIAQVEVGQAVWFDDGKLGARVIAATPAALALEVSHAKASGKRLKRDKGVNFPDSALRLDPLTDKDLSDLPFILQHADLLGYSFVQRPEDLDALEAAIAACSGPARPLVLKVETRLAVANLPELIVRALGRWELAVMLARGDLAVELGYARLAEMQEELLWLCEAAQVPVIWATQVFEALAKTGLPSRAELTDVAMAERAECVMLNKGPHIVQAVAALADVLSRLQEHQQKKRPTLRALRSWQQG